MGFSVGDVTNLRGTLAEFVQPTESKHTTHNLSAMASQVEFEKASEVHSIPRQGTTTMTVTRAKMIHGRRAGCIYKDGENLVGVIEKEMSPADEKEICGVQHILITIVCT